MACLVKLARHQPTQCARQNACKIVDSRAKLRTLGTTSVQKGYGMDQSHIDQIFAMRQLSCWRRGSKWEWHVYI